MTKPSRFRRPEWVSYLLDLWDHYIRRIDRQRTP